MGGQSGEGRRLASDAPHNGERHPPGDALPPPPQRATPARKGARCGAGAGKYTVRTGAGLTPFLEPGSGVPQGGAEGPFLYLLVTLPLALTIEQDYPAYAPYPLVSPLVGFADVYLRMRM